MKIKDIRTNLIASAIHETLPVSYGTRTHFTFLTVEVVTDEGVSGFGESVGLFHPTADAFLHTEIKPLLLGEDPLQIEYLNHRLDHLYQWNSFAAYPISAIDTALYDLKGKMLRTPVYELLGGLYQRDVNYSAIVHIHSVEEDVRRSVELVGQGYRTLKVKVGRDSAEDEARVRAIREAVGKDVRIRLDPNMAWSPRTAVRMIHRLARYNLEYVEQPIAGWDVEGMAEVARAGDVPLAADEGCQSPRDALRLAEARACEVFCVYLSESGGITRMKEIAAIAKTAGIHCVTGTWGESGIGFAAGLHVAASSRAFAHLANDQAINLLVTDYTDKPFRISGGRVAVPDSPGLGVTPVPEKMRTMKDLVGKDKVFTEGRRFLPIQGTIQC
jgi:L-alanine-DL-glutamate epimerase-like enolase superfamily enzyme